jgi:hypothetical protein
MLLPSPLIYRKGASRRLHNRRVAMIQRPDGCYKIHCKRLMDRGEAEELYAQGFQNRVQEQIIRGRIMYTVTVCTPEAFEALVWCQAQLQARQQRKPNF